jgi:hypothetical protein
VKCLFCFEECLVLRQDSIIVEICNKHLNKVRYYYYADLYDEITYSFEVDYQNRLWYFLFENISGVVTLYISSTKSNSDIIINNATNITPENALQKLPLIITFS